jgi:fatty-acyl-CoA synthase
MLTDSTRWLSQWAIVQPGKTAVITPTEEITFAALDERISRFANSLHQFGIGKGDRVGCLLNNCVDFLVTFYGTLRAGAVFVSLNTRLSAREMIWIIQHSDIKLAVTEAAFDDIVSACGKEISQLQLITIDHGGLGAPLLSDILKLAQSTFASPVAAMSDHASINYTSGTTGYPKGVVLTHEALDHALFNGMLTFGLSRFDKGLLALPLCFTGGLISLAHPMLNAGQTLVLERGFDGQRVAELIDRHKVTFTAGVPTTWQAIVAAAADNPAKLSSLRLGTVGGAPVPPTLLGWFQENGIGVVQSYGLTEGGGYNLCLENAYAHLKPGSVGRPTLTSEAMILGEDGQPAKPNEIGELLLRGPSIMSGYWNDTEKTKEAFHDGWLKTGDLARCDEDGCYYIVDRKKDMIISGGLNIYPAEVERVIYELPAIQDACVIGVPDEKWGESVTAVVVVRPGASMSSQEIINHCRDFLGSYKCPRRVEFVTEIPKTAAGKLLKRELRGRFV